MSKNNNIKNDSVTNDSVKKTKPFIKVEINQTKQK